jgi:hypothetical protein
MRYLHSVGPLERFVASGSYGDDEQWSIHQHPDGSFFYRVDSERHGAVALMEAWQSPEGRVERVEIVMFNAPEFKRGKLSYSVIEDQLEAGYQIGHDSRHQFDEMALPDGAVLALDCWLFMGLTVNALIVVTPPPLLAGEPVFRAQTVEPQGAAEISVNSRPVPTHAYTVNGVTRLWVDAFGVPVKVNDVTISRYARQG